MTRDWRVPCKDCGRAFSYSDASVQDALQRGQSPPERCAACRRLHGRAASRMGAAYLDLAPGDRPPPPTGIKPSRLGRIQRGDRIHRPVDLTPSEPDPDEFGINDEHIRHLLGLMDGPDGARVAVIQAPTGSGKSTYLPWRLLVPPDPYPEDHITRHGQIVVTQPRIRATEGIPRFIAEHLHGSRADAGLDIGYRHSKAPDRSDLRNRLIYATDGTLLNIIRRGELPTISTVVIDEAHERSLNIDLILALMRRELTVHPHLRLLIVSATITASTFTDLFEPELSVVTVQMPGKPDKPVHERFWSPPEIPTREWPALMPAAVATAAHEVLRWIAVGDRPADIPEDVPAYDGDLLAFLPGRRAIGMAASKLATFIADDEDLDGLVEILPLYAELAPKRQNYALDPKRRPKGKRWRVILSTNMAETSLTVEGVRHVIDSGLINSSMWEPASLSSAVRPVPHSQSGLRQRRGRAGRVAPGVWHCLFSRAQFDALHEDTPPEIVRAPLESLVLTATMAGVSDPASLRWLAPAPPSDELRRATARLRGIGAIDRDGDPTSVGRELSTTRESFDAAALLMAADQAGVAIEAATVLAALRDRRWNSVLRWGRWPAAARLHVDRVHQALLDGCSDDVDVVLGLVAAYEAIDPSERSDWAEARFLSESVLDAILSDRQRLLEPLQQRTRTVEVRAIDERLTDRLRRVIAWSNPNGIYEQSDGGEWVPLEVPRCDPQVVQAMHDGATLVMDFRSHLSRTDEAPRHLVTLARDRRRQWTTPLTPPAEVVTLSFCVALGAEHISPDVPLVVHTAAAVRGIVNPLPTAYPGQRFTVVAMPADPDGTARPIAAEPPAPTPADEIDAEQDAHDADESGDLDERSGRQGRAVAEEDGGYLVSDLVEEPDRSTGGEEADPIGAPADLTEPALPDVVDLVEPLDEPSGQIVQIEGMSPRGRLLAGSDRVAQLAAFADAVAVGQRFEVEVRSTTTLHRDQRRLVVATHLPTKCEVVLAADDLGWGLRDALVDLFPPGKRLRLYLEAVDVERGLLRATRLPDALEVLRGLSSVQAVDGIIVDAWERDVHIWLDPSGFGPETPIVVRVYAERLPRRPSEMSVGQHVRVRISRPRPPTPVEELDAPCPTLPSGPFEARGAAIALMSDPGERDLAQIHRVAALLPPAEADQLRNAISSLVYRRMVPLVDVVDVALLTQAAGTGRVEATFIEERNGRLVFECDGGRRVPVPGAFTHEVGEETPSYTPGDRVEFHAAVADPASGDLVLSRRDPSVVAARMRGWVARIQELAETSDWIAANRELRELDQHLRDAGHAGSEDAALRQAYRDARSEFATRRAAAEEASTAAKEALLEKAVKLKDKRDLPGAADKAKRLRSKWSEAGHAGRAEQGLRQQFDAALQAFWDRLRATEAEFYASIAVDDVVEGTISGIADDDTWRGATFRFPNGFEGSVPLALLAHGRVKRPGDAVLVGQTVQAKVIVVDPQKRRIRLSIRDALPDPFEEFADRTRDGDTIFGTVTNIVETDRLKGAFVEVAPGVEGLVHISKLANRHVARVSDVVAEHQTVRVRVLKIERSTRKISLSMRET